MLDDDDDEEETDKKEEAAVEEQEEEEVVPDVFEVAEDGHAEDDTAEADVSESALIDELGGAIENIEEEEQVSSEAVAIE